jgi:ferrous iron transport protein B
VAVAGNPNTGKTALFNALTDSHARVGNYPGLTVERRHAKTRLGGVGEVEILDIPGTYSLLSRTREEQIAVDTLLGMHGAGRPAAVVICVSATALVRGLYLVLQAREMGVPVVVALTMVDELGDAAPDASALARALGCPVVPVVAPKHRGLDALRAAMAQVIEAGPTAPHWTWQPSPTLGAEIRRVRDAFPADWPDPDALALWALMSVDADDELTGIPASVRAAVTAGTLDGRAVDDEVVTARYRWLRSHVEPLVSGPPRRALTDRVDRLLLHRVGGFAVFLAIMFVVFQSLFAWSDPAITLVETVFGHAGAAARALLPAGLVADFVVDGVIAGVGSVVVFLPQILLLFLFIGIMEDSGYMARVAYLMDRVMRTMNLHGRAFVPMMSGFACAVPAVLATRTLERRRDRLLTMLVVPLMTCSARLPVYSLVIAALFPAKTVLGVFPAQGLLMVCMYAFSVLIALIAAWVLSRTLKPLRGKRLPFVIELPPYRMPHLRDVARMMWQRTSVFLKEAGTVILVCTIALWALLSFPRELEQPSKDYAALARAAASPAAAAALEHEWQGELLRRSYGGRLGHLLEPAIEPLGFDWKIGVGLIGAFAAREVFVSTLGVVYSIGDEVDEADVTLRQKIRAEVRADGTRVYSPLVGLSLMVFFALACQCMSTLAVVKRETGTYRWPAFLFAYMTGLAWVASFLVFQVGRVLGFG